MSEKNDFLILVHWSDGSASSMRVPENELAESFRNAAGWVDHHAEFPGTVYLTKWTAEQIGD